MSDYKSTIKSNVQSVELQKKKVKVTCHNAKAGNLVITTLSQNMAIFDGKNYDIDKGIDGAKDFHVKFKEKDHAQKCYDNIMAIINDKSVELVEAEKSGLDNFKEKAGAALKKVGETVKNVVEQSMAGGAAPADEASMEEVMEAADMPMSEVPATGMPAGGNEGEGGGNKKIMIIGGAVAIVLVLGIVLWVSKK